MANHNDVRPREKTASEELRSLVVSLLDRASGAQVSVTMQDAAKMLGLKDTRSVRKLVEGGYLRARNMPDSNVVLVSIQSIRKFMGDE